MKARSRSLARQVGQAGRAQRDGGAEGDPDLGLPGLGVVADRRRGCMACLEWLNDGCDLASAIVWRYWLSSPVDGSTPAGIACATGTVWRYFARPRALMSTTQDLVTALKAELQAPPALTYADLADGARHVGVERQAHLRQGRHAALAHRRDPARAEDGFRRAGAARSSTPSRWRSELTRAAGGGGGGRPQAAAAGDLLPQPVDVRADRPGSTPSATPSASSTWPGSTTSASSSCGRSTATGSRSRRAFAGGRTAR